jgi:hypothetical protein
MLSRTPKRMLGTLSGQPHRTLSGGSLVGALVDALVATLNRGLAKLVADTKDGFDADTPLADVLGLTLVARVVRASHSRTGEEISDSGDDNILELSESSSAFTTERSLLISRPTSAVP